MQKHSSIFRRIFYPAVLTVLVSLSVLAYEIIAPAQRKPAILSTETMRYAYQSGDELLGGGTTVTDTGRGAYGRSVANIVRPHWSEFYRGKVPFIREWDEMPDGSRPPLGPLFSAVSCERCHEHDGRGKPPEPGEISESMIVRFSVPAHDGSWQPDPVYGDQLDMYGSNGVHGEGIIHITHHEVTGDYADGSSYTLMEPEYSFKHLAYGPLSPDLHFSPRVAPFNFGLGLLEAIPEEDILANADPTDRNRDGISGRANIVTDVRNNCRTLGRFGWKAGQPTIEQQIAKAFDADLGITSSLYPKSAANGDLVRRAGMTSTAQTELGAEDLQLIVSYVRLLGVPRQRNWQRQEVRHGRAIFDGIGCASCHATEFRTGAVLGFPELSYQLIHPYTDLLLHDMGEGLADNHPDGQASGREWRTPPLWGIGLVRNVNGHTRYLHDGRARNLEEAILWHGGEGAASQEAYRRLARVDRAALLAFLESL